MKRIPAIAAVALLFATPCFAQTNQETASQAFKSVVGGPTPSQEQYQLNVAIASMTAQRGGYGPAISNTNIAGDYINNNTYNGPVTNNGSTAYNSVNSNSTSANIQALDGSKVTFIPSVDQNSNSANQNASAAVLSNSNNGSTIGK